MADHTAICEARDLASGKAPELVHILPQGVIRGRDGRRFVLRDAQAVIKASNSAGLDMVVDYEHEIDDPANKAKGPVRAAGWIKELVAKADGIWGRVEWTRTARNMIADREYRYLSPVLVHRTDGTVMRVKGLSLVHRPNLELTALSSQEDTMAKDTDELPRIATALGLKADAGLTAILSAIDAAPARPDPARYVPIEAVQELMASRGAAVTSLQRQEAEARVNDATDKGYMTPAMWEWAVALREQDSDSFDAFIGTATPAYAHLSRKHDFGAAPKSGAQLNDPLALSICSQLGIDPSDLASRK